MHQSRQCLGIQLSLNTAYNEHVPSANLRQGHFTVHCRLLMTVFLFHKGNICGDLWYLRMEITKIEFLDAAWDPCKPEQLLLWIMLNFLHCWVYLLHFLIILSKSFFRMHKHDSVPGNEWPCMYIPTIYIPVNKWMMWPLIICISLVLMIHMYGDPWVSMISKSLWVWATDQCMRQYGFFDLPSCSNDGSYHWYDDHNPFQNQVTAKRRLKQYHEHGQDLNPGSMIMII